MGLLSRPGHDSTRGRCSQVTGRCSWLLQSWQEWQVDSAVPVNTPAPAVAGKARPPRSSSREITLAISSCVCVLVSLSCSALQGGRALLLGLRMERGPLCSESLGEGGKPSLRACWALPRGVGRLHGSSHHSHGFASASASHARKSWLVCCSVVTSDSCTGARPRLHHCSLLLRDAWLPGMLSRCH